MRLGGITWWRNNYGSILQAFALQKYLENDLNQEYVIINQYSKKMASTSNLVKKLKECGIKTTFKRLVGRFGLPKLRKRVQSLQEFVDANLLTTDMVYSEENIADANKEFDGFICGSDQIWNPANTSLDSMYWLGFVDKNKLKIAYAPSIGIENAENNVRAKIKSNLCDFDAISSREESGSRLINSIMGDTVCTTVADPTFLVDKILWDDLSDYRVCKNKYIFAYILKGTKQERKTIEKFAKSQGLSVLTIPFLDGEHLVPYDIKFGDVKLWDASPSDFISAIRNAECVFTDSFHCMVFSCFYHKKFYVFQKKGKLQMSRILGLQDLLLTGNRVVSSDCATEVIGNMPEINWKLTEERIQKYRNSSREYLVDAIERGVSRCQ